mgnify:CR=1 FL=1
MKKRVIALVVVTAVWVLVMAVFFYTLRSVTPLWGWAILAALWWFAIERELWERCYLHCILLDTQETLL